MKESGLRDYKFPANYLPTTAAKYICYGSFVVANMDKVQRFLVLGGFLAISFSLFLHLGSAANTADRWMPQNTDQELMPSSPVKLNKWKDHVMLDNGIVKLTLLSPSGLIAEIQYK
ncbi:unnamed protein product [Fraxinus pennsylvanica]|uniref:Uncharacterized protein n=1 Tax=Fraxinus pennsylvanica TaxID=56036 RepID=A0AAD2DLB0_9LAMI|nr:unnamed protein product [Fraxinus pennsylvanica]